LQWANQIGLLQKNKVELVRHPQQINVKQNKYAQFIMEVSCSLQVVLARAKNGDDLFWKEKFHAANGKAQACTQHALIFLIGRWEDSCRARSETRYMGRLTRGKNKKRVVSRPAESWMAIPYMYYLENWLALSGPIRAHVAGSPAVDGSHPSCV